MKCNSEKINRWQTSLIEAVTDPKELIELLELDAHWIKPAETAAKLFPLKVPRSFIKRMKKGDPFDPLLKQVLPLAEEHHSIAGYVRDPLQENHFNPRSGLLHKYKSRVLLTLTSACAVNCRFCFRRHFDYEKNTPGTTGWEEAMQYIASDNNIHEVILSGGDPLVVPDQRLALFTQKLASIPHVKRLRLHTRLPIVMPERITSELTQAISHPNLKTIMVIHCNHPQEINEDVTSAMKLLTGIVLLNQSVLLKGINDNVDTLAALSETLFDNHVLPYYLHILDKVDGTAHFDLSLDTAVQLHKELCHRLSGYLVPKLVCEQAGFASKTWVNTTSFYTGQN